MCQLIFLIYYLFRRPKIARLTAEMYPNVPSEDFLLWKKLELRSIDIFLWGTAALAIISFFAGALVGSAHPSNAADAQEIYMEVQIGCFLAMLIVLGISVVPNSKAQKISKQYGITVA